MPTPLPLPVRQRIFSLHHTGLCAADVARQLSLPPRTVSRLVARFDAAAGDRHADVEVDLAPSPGRGGCPLSQARSSLRQACLDLRRANPGWGAGRIELELSQTIPKSMVPPRARCSAG
jgi:hypothetical protein